MKHNLKLRQEPVHYNPKRRLIVVKGIMTYPGYCKLYRPDDGVDLGLYFMKDEDATPEKVN